MKVLLLTTLTLLITSLGAFAQAQTIYFERKSAENETKVSLFIDEEFVSGNEFTGVPETDDIAYGEITGKVRKDGLLHVTFNYMIEGSQQSEEQILKLDGDKLFIGEGELEERGPGQMVLKDRETVKFTKALQKLPLTEPALDSPEAKAVTKALQGPAAKLTGVPVTFEGLVRISDEWAVFMGSATAEGKKPKDSKMADKMDQRAFRAFLKKDAKGGWKVLCADFANQDGYFEFEGEFENAPWQLTDGLDEEH